MELETSRMIEFDEEKHIYTVDGKVYSGVTSILGKLGVAESFEGVDEGLLRARTARGKRIHKAVELYNKGLLDMASVHEDDRPFVEAYLKFTQDFPGWKSVMQERSFYAKFADDTERGELGYCGRIDDISLIKPGHYTIMGRNYDIGPNCVALFDDKTSASIVPSYRFQVGGGYLWGVANGVDGNDLDMSLTESISHMIGGEVDKVFCFIRHLRKGHYFLFPVSENETYAMWEKMLQKYFYPNTRGIDIEKMVKNQIDIPEAVARRLVRTKLLKDAAETKYNAIGEQAIGMLCKDGMQYNGVAEIGGYRVTYTKSFSGWKETIDEAAFIKAVLSTPAEAKMSGKEINDLYSSFKRGYETEGSWRRNVKAIKTAKAKKPASAPKEDPATSGKDAPAQVPENNAADTVAQADPANSGKPQPAPEPAPQPMAPGDNPQTTVFDVLGTPPPNPKAGKAGKKGDATRSRKAKREQKPEAGAAAATPGTQDESKPKPDDFVGIPASLVSDIKELANRVFPGGMRYQTENDVFVGWRFSPEFREFLAQRIGIVPLRSLTEGQCRDLQSILNTEAIKKDAAKDEGASRVNLLATQLTIEVMNAYRISELDAQYKIMEFCRTTYMRTDWKSFGEVQLRDLINKMGAAMAHEFLDKKKEEKPEPSESDRPDF